MKKSMMSLVLAALLALSAIALPQMAANAAGTGGSVQVTYSSYNDNSGSYKLSVQPSKTLAPVDTAPVDATIQVDPSITYQSFVGFGGTMINDDIYELNRLSPADKTNALKALFDPTVGNNYTLMRLEIGCVDFCSDYDPNLPDKGFWTYDDNGGVADPALAHFSIQKDIDNGTISTLQQVLQINPKVKFFASVWSPPAWMKDNGSLINGGSVLPQYYSTLADYYRKFVEAYQAQGIPIYAVTLQNEPQINMPYPTTVWTPAQQASFAVTLGQNFASHGLKTKIWALDDNSIHAFDFGEQVLKDPSGASPYIDGLGFHNYDGLAMTSSTGIHYQYPDKTLHLTEITNGAAKLVQYFRNWLNSYDYWMTFGEFMPGPGPGYWQNATSDNPDFYVDTQVSWAGTPGSSSYKLNAYYYTFGQFSRFIQPGAVRIDSTDALFGGNVTNVAFKNPDGTIVLVVVNRIPTDKNSTNMNTPAKTIRIATPDGQFIDTIPGDTVATYRWTPTTGDVLSPAGWSASASNTNGSYSAKQAIDESSLTLWNSGTNQASGQWFTLNLGSAKAFDQISLNQGQLWPNDNPGSYQVFTSSDGVNWGSAIASGTGSNGMTNITFAPQTKQYVKVQLTASASRGWTIGNVSLYNSKNGLLPRDGWTASASSTETNGSPSRVLDGSLETRWSNGAAPAPGQWFQVDMGSARTFNKIDMDTGPSVGDYARGYSVAVSNDGVNWSSPIASGTGLGQDIQVSFPSQTARYIRVTQTGSSNNTWWSIAEFRVYNQSPPLLNRSGWTASAFSTSGTDVPANTLDGSLTTRWSSGTAQANGQWFQVDMGKINAISGVTLNASTSTGDYPRGYQVSISMDGTAWRTVASGSIPAQDNLISFPVEFARYVKVTQTGTASGNWWSIHDFNVLGVPTPPSVGTPISHSGWTATAQGTGFNSTPAMAIDGELNTNWTTGNAMAGTEFFQVDLGSTQSFSMVELNASPSLGWSLDPTPSDAPVNYEVYVSNGGAWTMVAQGSTTGQPVTRITFPTQNARYINVHQTGTSSRWWTIGEFNVYR
ncbi:discoidin domain-containing protein [Cohnella candidum]|uniref:F5/8 type C domain-containing protein n=1 Tax=Cohnella candidum TaxID=2674991 RepID=A0A3G3JUL0_9BACL|nr:discoidin domain-containing protein [Cohnella candidum]AYQ71547.1 hypothetical protein EAV92_02470 [Cohnella candidum]